MLLKLLTKSRHLLNFASAPRTTSHFTANLCSQSTEMAKKAVVFLAAGAEEMEAVIAIDVLRRGGIDVTVAGVPDDSNMKCSRGVVIKPDVSIAQVFHMGTFDVMVLPGGLGGSKVLSESTDIACLLREQEEGMRFIAAICAAPMALKAHGICAGKTLTSYPSVEKDLTEGGKYVYKHDNVVRDDFLITSRGPGTAFDFALTIVDVLLGKEKASEVAKAMLLTY